MTATGRPGGWPVVGAVPPAAAPEIAEGLSERHALAVLVSVDGLGPATLGRLIARFGTARAVLAAARRGDRAALTDATRNEGRQAVADVVTALIEQARDADAVVARVERAAVDLVTLDDPDYPPRLRAIERPPHVLFLRGSRAALSATHAVAVVGTRRPTEGGRLTAGRIAGAIARVGGAIVSGLAVGIDGAAHAAALIEGGTTIGVLAGGHDRLYPRSHRRLVDEVVARGGAVVSEMPPDAEPVPGLFPRRNRIISGLSDATVVVEAGIRSGALLTAAWAVEQGRECFLVPGPLDRPTSAGCLAFLRDATGVARVVAGIPELLEDLGLADGTIPGGAPIGASAGASLVEVGEVARRIGAEIVRGHGTVDELVRVTGLPVATVLAAVTMLEMHGLVVDAYGRYRAAGRLATGPAPRRRTPGAALRGARPRG